MGVLLWADIGDTALKKVDNIPVSMELEFKGC